MNTTIYCSKNLSSILDIYIYIYLCYFFYQYICITVLHVRYCAYENVIGGLGFKQANVRIIFTQFSALILSAEVM